MAPAAAHAALDAATRRHCFTSSFSPLRPVVATRLAVIVTAQRLALQRHVMVVGVVVVVVVVVAVL